MCLIGEETSVAKTKKVKILHKGYLKTATSSVEGEYLACSSKPKPSKDGRNAEGSHRTPYYGTNWETSFSWSWLIVNCNKPRSVA